MYLDDGISRDSAPANSTMDSAMGERTSYGESYHLHGIGDERANDKYTKVKIEQVCCFPAPLYAPT